HGTFWDFSGLIDLFSAAHIGAKSLRNCDAAVGVLIVLHHRDQRAADGDAGAVQRMDEAGPLPFGRTIASLHAPRLEIAADRTGRNLAIGVLAGQPDLDVVGLLRAEAHVAGA